jgi:glycosyltransferase involved in cell wall biosynthesis
MPNGDPQLRIAICTPGNVEFSDYATENLLGTEYQIWGLAQELTRRGHDVQIVRRWDSRGPQRESIRNVTILNVGSADLHDFRLQKLLTKSVFSMQAKERLTNDRPDVIILTDLFTSLHLANLRIKKVFVAHNPPAGLSSAQRTGREAVKRLLEYQVFRNCQFLVALNKSIFEGLTRRSYRTVLIPNAVNINRYPQPREEGNYILSAGRLERIKGLHYLLDAYAEIDAALRKQFRLRIIGYGPEKNPLRARAFRLGIDDRVDFVEWQHNRDLVTMLSACTAFILPSVFEVCPVTLIEAMACGKTVLSSDIPGPRDIIEHDHSGLLFESGSVGALKKGLETVLRDQSLRKKLGANARIRVEDHFTFEQVAPRYEKILESA